MSDARDSFLDLEKHRLRLEDNVDKLRKALQHWQTWDAEYEALKEEVEAVTAADQAEELRRIHTEFDGELLNGKEIDDIIGQPKLKTKEQIINVLERRIDYVSQNISTLQKQLETAENKYAAATVISQPDATDEDGQPILDIVEELDDDDNVVSFRLNKPGDSLGNVEALLEKAGITDDAESKPEKEDLVSSKTVDKGKSPKGKERDLAPVAAAKLPSPKLEVKKTVSFSEDTKPAEESEPEISWRAKRVKEIMGAAKDQEDISMQAAVIPKDESPEDAALRQQMLRYGMSEVGAVVAELELEEGDSDEESEDGEDFDDEYDDYDEEDDEDQYGRYKGSVVTDQYRQRMLQLEKKLGIKSHSSKSRPKVDDEDASDDDNDEGIGHIVVNREAAAPSSSLSTAPKAAPLKSNLKEKQTDDSEAKKGVRFAASLDIAPENKPSAPVVSETKKKDIVEPLSDLIVERSSSSKPIKTEAQPAKRASRFKKTRDSTDSASVVPKGPLDIRPNFVDEDRPAVPTGPEGATIADKLVERESTAAAIAPDEVNDMMSHQEVADEYQRMRRKFIQREGGFLKPDESPIQPVRDEEDEEPISRFKAARLSRQ
ncbi:Prefoldin subunit domain-containing protein [Trichoderma sp. SZMC 28013]